MMRLNPQSLPLAAVPRMTVALQWLVCLPASCPWLPLATAPRMRIALRWLVRLFSGSPLPASPEIPSPQEIVILPVTLPPFWIFAARRKRPRGERRRGI